MVVRKYHSVLGLCLEYIEAAVVVPVGGRLERGLSSVELVTGVAFGAYCQARHGFGRTITWYGAAHLHSKTLYRKCSRRSGRCVLPSYSPCLN